MYAVLTDDKIAMQHLSWMSDELSLVQLYVDSILKLLFFPQQAIEGENQIYPKTNIKFHNFLIYLKILELNQNLV